MSCTVCLACLIYDVATGEVKQRRGCAAVHASHADGTAAAINHSMLMLRWWLPDNRCRMIYCFHRICSTSVGKFWASAGRKRRGQWYTGCPAHRRVDCHIDYVYISLTQNKNCFPKGNELGSSQTDGVCFVWAFEGRAADSFRHVVFGIALRFMALKRILAHWGRAAG